MTATPLHTAADAGPDPVDVWVGRAIRDRRNAMEATQSQLAQHLGVTFQQVQKYERGTNRVSASMLFRAAAFLGCQPGDLFPDAVAAAADDEAPARADALTLRLKRLIDALNRAAARADGTQRSLSLELEAIGAAFEAGLPLPWRATDNGRIIARNDAEVLDLRPEWAAANDRDDLIALLIAAGVNAMAGLPTAGGLDRDAGWGATSKDGAA